MDRKSIFEQLKIDEGVEYHIYLDHLGYPTFGVGHLVLESDAEYGQPVGTPVSEERVQECFEKDLDTAISECEVMFGEETWCGFPSEVQEICVNMMFNLGRPRFSKFKNTIKYFKTNKDGTYDLSEVDEKINDSIKKVTGDELDISNKEVINKVLLWGSVRIYLADKKFSKEDQQRFEKRFGEKTTISIKSLLNISKMSLIEKRVEEAFNEAEVLLKSDKQKIIDTLKKIFSETDDHSEEAKSILKKLISKLEKK